MPITVRRQMVSRGALCALSWLKRKRPRQARASPIGESQRELNQSASAPLNGATTASVNGKGVSIRTAATPSATITAFKPSANPRSLVGKVLVTVATFTASAS